MDAGSPPDGLSTWRAYRAILGSDRAWIALVMVLAITVRLDFLIAGEWIIDADEAIVGLMAKHMLEGKGIPTFYYGQHYMGSLEPMLVAVSFAIFGVYNVALLFVPLLFAIMLVPIMYLLGIELCSRPAARIGSLLAALPPVGLVVWSTKARGGFIEIVVIGALAMLLACRWLKDDTPKFERTAAIGLLIGLGWWTNNQIIYFAVPIAIFMAARFLPWNGTRVPLGIVARHAAVGTMSFLLGSAPYWVYNVEHDFVSLAMFDRATFGEILRHLRGLFTIALPILMGAKKFWERDTIFPGVVEAAYVLYGIVAVQILVMRRRAIFRWWRLEIDRVKPVELFLLFVVVSCAVFATSSFGWLVQAPRYLLPLYVGIFPLIGLAAERISTTLAGQLAVSVPFLMINVSSMYLFGRAIPGEPVVFAGERVSKDHRDLIAWLDDHGYDFVRTNYWIGYRLAFETEERIRFVIEQEPFTTRIAQYEDSGAVEPKLRVPMVLVPRQGDVVKRAFRVMRVSYKEVSLSGYTVLFDVGDFAKPEIPIPRGEFTIEANAHGDAIDAAVDGALSTRWGSAHPQTPGQTVTVTFRNPTPVTFMGYDLGGWKSDFPRRLSIAIEYADGTWEDHISPAEYDAVRYVLYGESFMWFGFDGKPVKRVVLKQEGAHPVFDWSIAELSFYRE